MFRWYQGAEKCLAYLKYVASELGPAARYEAILKSEWFKRGWTLQELLAPEELVFISSDWSEVLGSRFYFSEVIFRATGIQNDDFWELRGGGVSVARRISWASRRTCTREEDETYCLMGLLGVNMPLLYGEGKNAFKRLQQELLKGSDDESIFAWWVSRRTRDHAGLLASSPHDFRYSSWVHPFPIDREARPYSMTNKGLQLDVSLLDISELVITEHFHVGYDGTIVTRKLVEASSLGPKGQMCAIKLNCFLKRSPLKDTINRNSVDTRPNPIIIILNRVTDSSNTYPLLRLKGIQQVWSIFLGTGPLESLPSNLSNPNPSRFR
jgi:hypothetical protein